MLQGLRSWWRFRAHAVDIGFNVFDPPRGNAGAELHRCGETSFFDALPPCAFADRDKAQDGGQT